MSDKKEESLPPCPHGNYERCVCGYEWVKKLQDRDAEIVELKKQQWKVEGCLTVVENRKEKANE